MKIFNEKYELYKKYNIKIKHPQQFAKDWLLSYLNINPFHKIPICNRDILSSLIRDIRKMDPNQRKASFFNDMSKIILYHHKIYKKDITHGPLRLLINNSYDMIKNFSSLKKSKITIVFRPKFDWQKGRFGDGTKCWHSFDASIPAGHQDLGAIWGNVYIDDDSFDRFGVYPDGKMFTKPLFFHSCKINISFYYRLFNILHGHKKYSWRIYTMPIRIIPSKRSPKYYYISYSAIPNPKALKLSRRRLLSKDSYTYSTYYDSMRINLNEGHHIDMKMCGCCGNKYLHKDIHRTQCPGNTMKALYHTDKVFHRISDDFRRGYHVYDVYSEGGTYEI